MLAPHELKNKAFSKTMRGYTPSEVDDYIEFLLDAYTNLYRENSELERKLRIVVTNLDEIKDEEEAIRSTLLKSQKLGEKIIRDANEKAQVITTSIKDRCDAIIAEFRAELAGEKREMWSIRTKILDFKKNVYDLYRSHIEDLQAISVNELEDIVLPNESDIVNRIFIDVKSAIQKEIADDEKTRADADLNAVPALGDKGTSFEKAPKNEISNEDYVEALTQKPAKAETKDPAEGENKAPAPEQNAADEDADIEEISGEDFSEEEGQDAESPAED